MYEFKLPDLGEGVHEGQVINVLIKEGDSIEEFQPMLEVETDKAAVEIPSPKTGTVSKVNVVAGQTVLVGDVMLVIDDGSGASSENGETASKKKKKAGSSASTTAVATAPPPAPAAPATPRGDGPVPAAPVVRRLARERGIDLHLVAGSGPGGRVLKSDVENFGTAGAAPALASRGTPITVPTDALPDFSQYGTVRAEQPSQIRKTIARQMTKAWLSVPRVTHSDIADYTDLEVMRKKMNDTRVEADAKITMTTIVIKIVGGLLMRYPMLNCSYDAQNEVIVYKDFVNMGIAVDTARGLVVPVIRNVHEKSLQEIARDLVVLAEKARNTSFGIADLRGATFTITNVGSLGGEFVTPMVNTPEVGILGLGRGAYRPVVMPDLEIKARRTLPLSLSFDHRVCDGADAARFTADVVKTLEVPLNFANL